MDELRNLYPQAAYAEIDGAGNMSPVTHDLAVNEIGDTYISRLSA